MECVIFSGMAFLLFIMIIAVIWRKSSNRISFPCPSWLGWLVELDNPILWENRASVIISHLGLRPGMAVQDFGCGPGRLTIPPARQIGPAGRVTAFDLQPAMLERVRQKASRENHANKEFSQGAAGEGKLGDSQYDGVLLVTVLGEIPDRQILMKELFKCLKPGGLLSVTETIADPHFQTRMNVLETAENAGFLIAGFYGKCFSYQMVFYDCRKPDMNGAYTDRF